MKYEWKKNEKDLYGAKPTPALVTVPCQSYIMIQGKGNPNDPDFSERVSVLYALAYGVKMNYKAMAAGAAGHELMGDITDFCVYPLEGVWQKQDYPELIKDALEYTIMIKQPDFITREMVLSALAKVKKKKPSPLLDEIFFDTMADKLCIEILHIGTFDDEPASIKKMDMLAAQKGLKRSKSWHREIYLNNANRVSKSKIKTILRYCVE